MKEYINYYCSFKIYSQTISWQEMVDIIWLEPTKYWSKWELMHHGRNVYPSNGYIIDFYEKRIHKKKERSEIDPYLPNAINSFLDKLLKYKDWLVRITRTEEAYITIWVSGVSNHIGIQADTVIMWKLVELNLKLDCDIYSDG